MRHTIRKALILMVLLLLIPGILFAFGFTTRLTGVTTHPEFWLGMFPSSVRCFVGIEGLEFMSDRITEMGAEIATGTIARTLSQNPVSGQVISSLSDDTLKRNSYYDVMYASWKMGLAQGLGWSKQAQSDLMTLRFTLDGQWEVAIDPLMQITRTGYPFRNIPAFANAAGGDVLVGTPDLSGNRQLLSLSFDLYGKIKDQVFSVGALSGASMEFKFVWSPKFLNFSKGYGGVADYWKFWFYTDYSKMLYQAKDEKGLNKWSFGFSNAVEMRVLGGEHVPEYAKTLKSPLWWYQPENMTFLARDTLRLNYYGQQFLGNCIPYVYLFLDMSYSGGKLNNSIEWNLDSVWEGSMGLHVELQLFGAFHIYYEIGRIFLYTGDNQAYTPRFTTSALRVTVSLAQIDGVNWSI